MQKPAITSGGPCPRCHGQKQLKVGAKIILCPLCLGRGTSGYVTK